MSPAVGIAAVVLQASALTPACDAPPRVASPPADPPSPPATISARFADLDAYLAHLEKRSHMDGAWYRQIRPGVYELQTGNLRATDGHQGQRVFTRQELEKKFGFVR